jgi:desumoylating isopeptidase 1
MTVFVESKTYPVHLYVYDLSRGMARQLSEAIVGIPLEGFWHTSVVAYGVETYFGHGIQQSLPAQTHHGYPQEVIEMGRTEIPPELFREFLEDLNSKYHAASYDLFENNCNHFSQSLCEFLTGKNIPSHISDLPRTVLDTPLGKMLKPMLEQSFRPIVQAPTTNPATLRD